MSATATTTYRIVEIEANINALYEPEKGKVEYRMMNTNGDWILATSNWNALTQMTDEELREFYNDRIEAVACDSLARRFRCAEK